MGVKQPIDDRTSLEHEPELNKFFKAAIKTRASDLHLKVGQPPKLRLFGELKNTTGEILTDKRMEELVFEILSPAQKEFFLEHGTIDSLNQESLLAAMEPQAGAETIAGAAQRTAYCSTRSRRSTSLRAQASIRPSGPISILSPSIVAVTPPRGRECSQT